MSRTEQRSADRFTALTFLLNQEELDACLGAVPMTQELFDSILERCMGQQVDEFFYEMLSKYPSHSKGHGHSCLSESCCSYTSLTV